MRTVRLSPEEAARVAAMLLDQSAYKVFVGMDDIDQGFKVKVNGRTWSPPMGKVEEWL